MANAFTAGCSSTSNRPIDGTAVKIIDRFIAMSSQIVALMLDPKNGLARIVLSARRRLTCLVLGR